MAFVVVIDHEKFVASWTYFQL